MINLELTRIKRKGYHFYVALLLFISFFTLIPALIKPHWQNFIDIFESQVVLFIVFTNFFHILLNIVFQATMQIVYRVKLPMIEQFKISKQPFPFDAEDQTGWHLLRKKTLQVVLTNLLIIGPFFTLVDGYLGGCKCRFDLETFPSTLEILWQFLTFLIVDDLVFYWNHRLMHEPFLYQRFHQLHHEYNNVVSLAGQFAHPVEFVLNNIIPYSLAFQLLGEKVHFFTIILWSFWRLLDSVDGHCGYQFPWSPLRVIPFSTSSEFHNYHHSHNSGNFASFFTLWDYYMGTNSQFYKFQSYQYRLPGSELKSKSKKE